MSPELEQRLFKKYKRIFRTQCDSNGFAVAPHAYSIDCRDGWFHLVDRLLASINEHVESSRNQRARDLRYNRALKAGLAGNPKYLYSYFQFGLKTYKIEPWVVDRAHMELTIGKIRTLGPLVNQVHVQQIKEKFGTLRFYYSGGDEYIAGMVSLAESLSAAICEGCGSPGNKTRSGWIRVLCDACKNTSTF
jgi:hypothetical protein